MNKSFLAVATLLVMSAGAVLAFDPPRYGQNGKNGNTSQTPGRKQGDRQGKKLGPQDGSGPIHQPGTGGGSGVGRRAGRK
jgi:hypothetical protein